MTKNPCLIPPESAFKKGADLWLVCDPKQSPWNQHIDWYLSFLMKKNRMSFIKPLENYQAPQVTVIAQDIAQLIGCEPKTLCFNTKHYETPPLPKHKPSIKKAWPLLIKTANRLPNLWTVEIDYKNNTQWLSQAKTVWEHLNRPTLRLFAPAHLQSKDVQQTWPKEVTPIQYILKNP